MSKTITLLTGNERKKKSFEEAIAGYDIWVEIEKPWIPEIQSEDNSEVAAYSAKFGADLLQKPVIKMDSGFFIEGLGGFPGPLVHYADRQIGVELFFKMLEGLPNKNAKIKSSLAYCAPGEEPRVFESGCAGRIPDKLNLTKGSFIDQLFIPEHASNPEGKLIGQIMDEDYQLFLDVWGDAEVQFAKWYSSL